MLVKKYVGAQFFEPCRPLAPAEIIFVVAEHAENAVARAQPRERLNVGAARLDSAVDEVARHQYHVRLKLGDAADELRRPRRFARGAYVQVAEVDYPIAVKLRRKLRKRRFSLDYARLALRLVNAVNPDRKRQREHQRRSRQRNARGGENSVIHAAAGAPSVCGARYRAQRERQVAAERQRKEHRERDEGRGVSLYDELRQLRREEVPAHVSEELLLEGRRDYEYRESRLRGPRGAKRQDEAQNCVNHQNECSYPKHEVKYRCWSRSRSTARGSGKIGADPRRKDGRT